MTFGNDQGGATTHERAHWLDVYSPIFATLSLTGKLVLKAAATVDNDNEME